MTVPPLIVRVHEEPRRATNPVTSALLLVRMLTLLNGEPPPPITNDPLVVSTPFVIVSTLFELVLTCPILAATQIAVLTAPMPPMFKALLTVLPSPTLIEEP